MRFIHLFLVGYFVLAIGVALALWQVDPQPTRVLPVLSVALQDPEADIRQLAARGLAKMGPRAKEAVPALISLLHDEQGDVRKAAAAALKRVQSEEATTSGRP